MYSVLGPKFNEKKNQQSTLDLKSPTSDINYVTAWSGCCQEAESLIRQGQDEKPKFQERTGPPTPPTKARPPARKPPPQVQRRQPEPEPEPEVEPEPEPLPTEVHVHVLYNYDSEQKTSFGCTFTSLRLLSGLPWLKCDFQN